LGDLSAFVASITKRGLKFINIPTTLLAQVDSAIGGKTAINSKHGKNLVGTFYQPDFVISDIATLNSLPKKEMICGYGEILKHSLIADKKFFFWLSNNAKRMLFKKDLNLLKFAIVKSCKIKSKIVSLDEREKNLRMVLNFGHTFAHGFEGAKEFSKKLSHGEAVLLGMILASQLAYQKKVLSIEDLLLIKRHYILLGLPNNIKKIFNKNEINKIIYFVKKYKKNINNKINFILIKKIGKATRPNSFNISVKEFIKFLIESWDKKVI
jgi:3-dehydroquinate synthase/shikimate kinase/3-dehydroquinate synthase